MIPSFCVFGVGGCYYWISFVLHWEAAVTDFFGVPVEDFAQFVVLGEVLVDKGEEDFGDIGGYIDVEGGIKPCDFAFSCFVLTALLGRLRIEL